MLNQKKICDSWKNIELGKEKQLGKTIKEKVGSSTLKKD